MEKVWIKTKDGKEISGLYFRADKPKGWVLYLHMMPATKESWMTLAGKMASKGYSGIAVDLRGHGESSDGPDGYLKFSDSEHRSSINDVEAADNFLQKRGDKNGKGTIIGASIGANLALQYLSLHAEYKTGIFLSPGVDYRGVETTPFALKVPVEDEVLFVSSEDDLENPRQVTEIISRLPGEVYKDKIIYKTAGHGTNMLETKESPNLLNAIIGFVER